MSVMEPLDSVFVMEGEKEYVAIVEPGPPGPAGPGVEDAAALVAEVQAGLDDLTARVADEETARADGDLAEADRADATYVPLASKDLANGVPGLDGFGEIADARIPASIARDAEMAAGDAGLAATIAAETVRATAAEATKQATAEKNQANGYAGLDALGHLLDGQIPDAITRDAELATATAARVVAEAALSAAIDALALATDAQIALQIPRAWRNAANGVAPTDGANQVPDANIPAGIARDAEVTAQVAAEAAARDAAIAAAIGGLVAGAPGALDTLAEIAAQLGNDENAVAALTAVVAGKQAHHANLDAVSGLNVVADKVVYGNGAGTLGLADFTAVARALMAAGTVGAQRAALGLGDAATHAAADFDVAGAAAAAQAASQPLQATLTALVANGTPQALGLAMLLATTAADGRAVLGLGTAATHAHGDYDLAGAAAAAQAASQPHTATLDGIVANGAPTATGLALLISASAAAARGTLGLGTAATHAHGDYDLAGAAAAAQAASQPLSAILTSLVTNGAPSAVGLALLTAATVAAVRGQLGLGTAALLNSGVANAGDLPTRADGDARFAPKIRPVGSALATTGAVALDFAALNGTSQLIALTGNLTLTTANLAAGLELNLFISAAALRTFTFPAWKWLTAVPASVAAGKAGVLSLFSTTGADAGVYASWAPTP